MLYAFSSGVGNNGSAFAGLNANTPMWNTTLGLAMLAGRFLMILPLLALAGNLAKKVVPASGGAAGNGSGLRRTAGERRAHRGRVDLPARALAGTDPRTLSDDAF